MTASASLSVAGSESVPTSSAQLSALKKEIAALRAVVDPETPTFQAAVILLSSRAVGQNVDRLARFTGLGREVVARCARRLVDNGVWQDGKVVSTWSDSESMPPAFWRDVEVAEGKLCRRLDDAGNPEWALAGAWWKSYEFIDNRAESSMELRYYPRHVDLGPPKPLEDAQRPTAEPERIAAPTDRKAAVSPFLGGRVAAMQPPGGGARVAHLSAPELFVGAVWLQ